MRAIPLVARFGLVLAALSAPLSASDWIDNLELKMRLGLTSGSIMKDSSDNKAFGFGVGTAIPLAEGKAITVDFGFDYLPGRGEDVLPPESTKIYYDLAGTVISSFDGHPLYQHVSDSSGSAESRHRKSEGFSLRVGYRATIPAVQDLSWQAGVSLDRYKTTNEFVGNIVPVYTDDAGAVNTVDDDGTTAYEGWALSRQRTTLTPGFYAGLVYQVHENHKLEFNIRNIGLGLLDYKPLAYTGQPAALANKNSRGFVYELSLTVKL